MPQLKIISQLIIFVELIGMNQTKTSYIVRQNAEFQMLGHVVYTCITVI
jgi:hypothetical protein